MTHLKIGDKAPDFSILDQDGRTRGLSEFKGKKLVLYFYPQDDTPTCTTQACNLRDNYEILQENGYEILGVSPDKDSKHLKFIDKHKLPFSLLVDSDLKLCHLYGIWGPKKFMGREYDGIHRTSFIIDEKGKISNIIHPVKSKIHHQQILGNE